MFNLEESHSKDNCAECGVKKPTQECPTCKEPLCATCTCTAHG